MKTIKLFTLAFCALYLMACEKEKGPEKTLYPQTYVYAGVELHPSKYYRWEGGNTFTELPGVVFPEYHDDAELEDRIEEVYGLFYPFTEFTLENDSLVRVMTRETEDTPELDTTITYRHEGDRLVFFEEQGAFSLIWFFNEDFTKIEDRGYAYNFNYFDSYFKKRDFFATSIYQSSRLENTELDLLDLIVEENQQFLQPTDTIQLKFYEVVHELQ